MTQKFTKTDTIIHNWTHEDHEDNCSNNQSDKKTDLPIINVEQSAICEQTSKIETLVKQYLSEKDHIQYKLVDNNKWKSVNVLSKKNHWKEQILVQCELS